MFDHVFGVVINNRATPNLVMQCFINMLMRWVKELQIGCFTTELLAMITNKSTQIPTI